MSEILPGQPLIREKRLKSSSAFYDEAGKYVTELEQDDVKQRIRTFAEDTKNDVLFAIEALHTIEDAVIIVHGPRGCGSPAILDTSSEKKSRWITTNLNQRDSIMGSDAKLRKTVLQAYKLLKPAVIFIIATPVVAINNDDIQAVVDELSEEITSPIIPIITSGFKSKLGISGYDTAFHGIAKYLKRHVQPETKKSHLNVISITENKQDLDEIKSLLNLAGIESRFLPQLSKWEDFVEAVSAQATIAINPEDGDFLGKVLEEQFQVPYLKTGIPIGKAATKEWLQSILESLQIEIKDAFSFGQTKEIAEEHSEHIEEKENSKPLDGIKVYIHLKPSYAFEIAKTLTDHGADIVGVSVTHIDELHKSQVDERSKLNAQLHVSGGQHFEIINILKKAQPDIYIGNDGQYIEVAKLGIVPVTIESLGILGARGEENLIKAIKRATQNRHFVSLLQEAAPSHGYIPSWLQKRPSWYIKQEVK